MVGGVLAVGDCREGWVRFSEMGEWAVVDVEAWGAGAGAEEVGFEV